jgi:hypothetical protein
MGDAPPTKFHLLKRIPDGKSLKGGAPKIYWKLFWARRNATKVK